MVDHDRLFKELLTTFFAEFIELFLPEVSAYLDRDSIEFLDKEVFTDITSGEKHEADIVAKARFREQDAFFLIHMENQADPQANFGRRMFRYFARFHEKYMLPVYPVVIFSYDAPQRPEPDRYLVAFPDFTPLDFRYRVIQLNRLNWRDYIRQSNPIASALMAKMRIAPKDRPRVKLECLRLLATLRLTPAKMRLISGFVDTYLKLNAVEERQFQAEMEKIAPPQREGVMEIVTSWLEQGREQGRKLGIHQGREETLLRLLRKRCGELPEAIQERIRTLADAQLDALTDAVLDFESLSDLEAWLRDRA
jgi:hypothetical protein